MKSLKIPRGDFPITPGPALRVDPPGVVIALPRTPPDPAGRPQAPGGPMTLRMRHTRAKERCPLNLPDADLLAVRKMPCRAKDAVPCERCSDNISWP